MVRYHPSRHSCSQRAGSDREHAAVRTAPATFTAAMEVNVCTPKTLTVLGVEYQVVRQLGMGSYAQVFEVVRAHDGVRLAAKCIDQGPLSTWARKQLVCEVEIQQSLQHPSILRMHAAGEDAASGKYVSIQDVAYGGELFERIMEQSSFVEDDARRVIAQLLAAVEHMHSRGVLHRDLKPENILLESRPDLGLGFGLGFGLGLGSGLGSGLGLGLGLGQA